MGNFDGAFPFVWVPKSDEGWDGAFPFIGSPTPPVPPTNINFIAEILIGNEIIWSAVNSLPQQQLSIDVRRFNGTYPLTFRIRGTK